MAHPHNDNSTVTQDLRNKLTSIVTVFDQISHTKLPSKKFAKVALNDLDYIERNLITVKLPKVRLVLEAVCQAQQPSVNSIQDAVNDWDRAFGNSAAFSPISSRPSN